MQSVDMLLTLLLLLCIVLQTVVKVSLESLSRLDGRYNSSRESTPRDSNSSNHHNNNSSSSYSMNGTPTGGSLSAADLEVDLLTA
jgi:hypothetical protein